MKNSDEGCILQEQQVELKKKVENIDERLTKVEVDVGKMRSETQEGFKAGAEAMQQINTSVANLAHDFGQRFNNIETTVVAEKVKWGETLRWVVKMAVRVLLAGAAVAMGVTTLRMFMK
jgi:hypothetical protein